VAIPESVPFVDLVHRARTGDAKAATTLDGAMYAELRRLAQAMMRGQAVSHTLQPTALVHEGVLKARHYLGSMQAEDRAHLFRVIAQAMRQVLIDAARAKGAAKRGGGARKISLDGAQTALGLRAADGAGPDVYVRVGELVDRLRAEDPRAADVVHLKVFAGCTNAQIGEALGCSERTVARDWDFASRWLLVRLREDDGAE
jgi:RNA polymerase sigma factor (TIGR02999 family)